MRTIIYIDDFNPYYGSLKGTPLKWLDLKTLFTGLLGANYKILGIRYYIAYTSARPDDPDAPTRQMVYLNALKAYIPELSIIKGYFMSKPVNMRLVNPIGKTKFVDVIKTEEKGSDVNLAVHLLNDAWRDLYDCAVVVTNDSDVAEAMRLVKIYRKKKIILYVPGNPLIRPASNQLKRFAHKTYSIPADAIKNSQLPSPIPNTNFHKPTTW